jgi:hypothetical protein
MALELVIFPCMIGEIIDLCTIPLFGASFGSRWTQLVTSPFGTLFFGWLVGTSCVYVEVVLTLDSCILSRDS